MMIIAVRIITLIIVNSLLLLLLFPGKTSDQTMKVEDCFNISVPLRDIKLSTHSEDLLQCC